MKIKQIILNLIWPILINLLQSKNYANPEILTQVNSIPEFLDKNLKGDEKGREYTKRFYDLIPERTKYQDSNLYLVFYLWINA